MSDGKERLSNSAAKAKRNLLFLAVVAWALAFAWVRPRSGSTTISLGGVGLETNIYFILWSLAALLAYNLFSFWLHGPFGDGESERRKLHLFDPTHGGTQGVLPVYRHVVAVAGDGALPEGIADVDRLADWLNKQLGELGHSNWDSTVGANVVAIRCLWREISWKARLRLCASALKKDVSRRALLEDALDVWLPVLAGASGLLAIAVAFWRLA